MAYATKYYDYQIAIIFAILLAGMLLLAMVVGAIYFICVVNMRGKKNGLTRVPSGRSTVRTRMEWTQPQQQQYISAPQPQQYQQPQYGQGDMGDGRGYGQQQQQPQYSYPPQEQSPTGARVRELQPDYFQQQGPITYTAVHPYEQQQQQAYRPQTIPQASTSYHMSSV